MTKRRERRKKKEEGEEKITGKGREEEGEYEGEEVEEASPNHCTVNPPTLDIKGIPVSP